jgi:hypothetical protein
VTIPPKLVPAHSAPVASTTTPTGPKGSNNLERSYPGDRWNTGDRYAPRPRSREHRHQSDDEVVDGSYGFDAMDTDNIEHDRNQGRGLYSDDLVNRTGRGRRDDRDGGRGRDRGRGRR